MLRHLVRKAARPLTLAAIACAISPALLASQGTTGILQGVITDSITGEAIAEARIAVRGTPLTAFTDSSGGYLIAGIPAGTYTVRVAAARSTTVDRDTIRILAGRTTRLDAMLHRRPGVPAGSLVDGVPVIRNRLPPGQEHREHQLIRGGYTDQVPRCVADAHGVLQGVARDPEGRVIPGARISVARTALATQTDSMGRYRFPAVPPGRHQVRAAKPGYRAIEFQGLQVRACQIVAQDFTLAEVEVEIEDPLFRRID